MLRLRLFGLFFWRGHVAFREDNLQTTTRSPLTLVLHCGLLPILYLAEAKREYGPWMAFLLFLYDRHIFQVQQQARDYLRLLREVTRVLTDFDTLNLWHSYLERERTHQIMPYHLLNFNKYDRILIGPSHLDFLDIKDICLILSRIQS